MNKPILLKRPYRLIFILVVYFISCKSIPEGVYSYKKNEHYGSQLNVLKNGNFDYWKGGHMVTFYSKGRISREGLNKYNLHTDYQEDTSWVEKDIFTSDKAKISIKTMVEKIRPMAFYIVVENDTMFSDSGEFYFIDMPKNVHVMVFQTFQSNSITSKMHKYDFLLDSDYNSYNLFVFDEVHFFRYNFMKRQRLRKFFFWLKIEDEEGIHRKTKRRYKPYHNYEFVSKLQK